MASGGLPECPSTPDFEGFEAGENTVYLVKQLVWKIKALEEDRDKVRKRMGSLEEENKSMKEAIVKLREEIKVIKEEGGKLREESVALKEESVRLKEENVNLRDQLRIEMSEVKKNNEDMKTVVKK